VQVRRSNEHVADSPHRDRKQPGARQHVRSDGTPRPASSAGAWRLRPRVRMVGVLLAMFHSDAQLCFIVTHTCFHDDTQSTVAT
jgi:hypothetical protein